MTLSINNDSLAPRQLAQPGAQDRATRQAVSAQDDTGAAGDVRAAGAVAGGATASSIVSTLTGASSGYAGGYVASRYLHEKLKGLGVAGGIEGITAYLIQHQGANLDAALNAVSDGFYANTASLLADFGANGAIVADAGTGAGGQDKAPERIQNAEDAAATARLTRGQILQQAAAAIMVQANGEPNAVLALLR